MGHIERISPLAADVRSEDLDRYLATLFAPAEKRRSLFALYAFDNELARIERVVREPMAGLIRLQWWEDVIGGFAADQSVAHPIVKELKQAVTGGDLDPAWLKDAIEGRRRRYQDEQPTNIQAFEQYLCETGGSVTSAAAALLGVEEAAAMTVASQMGMVKASFDQLRLLNRTNEELKPWLPGVWIDDRELDRCDRRAATTRDNARRHLVDLGVKKLAEARMGKALVARSQLAAFFPGTLAGYRLATLKGFADGPIPPNGVPKLLWSWLRGRF